MISNLFSEYFFMKKYISLFLFSSFLFQVLNAQQSDTIAAAKSARSLFFELGGNGIFFSANYDARFSKSEKGLGYRAGIGIVPGVDFIFFKTSTFLTIPLGLNYLAGKGPGYFEAGLGGTFISGSAGLGSLFEGLDNNGTIHASGFGFIPSAGYRYAAIGKRFQGRIFISPIIGSGGSVFWMGLSAGMKL